MSLTSRRSQPPLALSVPLARFTSQVGGGSAFFVRPHIAMKITRAKFSILSLILICLSVALIGLSGCETQSEALAGYQWDGQPTQAIIDDAQSFIRSKKIPQQHIENIEYPEDYKTRRIAAVITVNDNYWSAHRTDYILYYNTNSVRIKVKAFEYSHFHM
jgi:hypothetical protein